MDKEFFVREIDRNSGRLFRVAYSLLQNREDCRDALQECALKAWEKRFSLRQEQYFATWITRILINECRNIQRRRKRTVPLEQIPEPALEPPDPTLSLALRALPERFRLPLVLQGSEGMSYREIAQTLGVTEAAVRGRVHRAKKMLRKELEV